MMEHPYDRVAAEEVMADQHPPGAPTFTCPKCGMVSYNKYDIEHMYCGNCHMWMRGWEGLRLPAEPYERLPDPSPMASAYWEGTEQLSVDEAEMKQHDGAEMPSRDTSSDDKYIVFKKEEFFLLMGFLALPPWRDSDSGELVGVAMDCAPLAKQIEDEVEKVRLKDAVVIRRQEKFASPALATYANMIGTVAALMPPGPQQTELLAISDYFEDQARLAAEESWKLPDL